MVEFILNDRHIRTDKPGGMTLLDFIRYEKHLTGTKIGCREGDCGACTILIGDLKKDQVEYRSMTSCIMPLANATGKHIVTIEGLNITRLSPVQKAFVDASGTQCGFCTVGFVVSLTGYCLTGGSASYPDGIASIDGNICRCTGYKSIERATADVVGQLRSKPSENQISWLVSNNFLPAYFLEINRRLKELNGTGNGSIVGSVVVGGGTDLYVQRPESLADEEINPFLNRGELKGITIKDDNIVVGGASTVTDLLTSPVMNDHFPSLGKFFKLISSTQIRNMGTVAGNFVNASPIGDLTIFFLALDATITLKDGLGKKRNVPLRNFYKAYKTLDKLQGEYVETISFRKPDSGTRFNFEKVSKRTNLDIASANSAIRINLDHDIISDVSVSAGGVGPTPLYLSNTCKFLKGQKLTPSLVKGATEILANEIAPITDARGVKEYKALLLRQIFFAHFIELFPEKFEIEALV